MLKFYQKFVGIVFTLSDLLMSYAALLLAYYLRFHSPFFQKIFPLSKGIAPLSDFFNFPVILLLSLVWISVFRINGLHRPKRWRSSVNLFITVFSNVTLCMTILVGLAFFYRELTFSRVVVGTFWILDIFFIFFARLVMKWVLSYLRRKGYNQRNILIVGAGKLGEAFFERIRANAGMGLQVVGFLDDDSKKLGKKIHGVPVLGRLDKIKDVIQSRQVYDIFIALPMSAHKRMLQLLSQVKDECISIKVIPDVLQYITIKSSIEDIDGIPIINFWQTPLSGWNAFIKRIVDILLSIFILIVTAPITLLFALLIKLTSEGPVLYRQERMGLDGRPFKMLKFRSMRVDAEDKTGPVFAVEGDPRITRLGALMRKLSIDELPQLINVLRGQMSLVGPRPERPPFVQEFREKIPRYMLRHKVKSGMTGWAQVHGYRGNTSIRKRLEYDLYYIENWSLMLDFKILILTLFRLHKNAV